MTPTGAPTPKTIPQALASETGRTVTTQSEQTGHVRRQGRCLAIAEKPPSKKTKHMEDLVQKKVVVARAEQTFTQERQEKPWEA